MVTGGLCLYSGLINPEWVQGIREAGMAGKFGAGVVAMGLMLALGACGGGATEAGSGTDAAAAPTAASGTTPDRGTVAGAIQDQMLVAIEKTYASRNAKTRLDGTVVHVSMDGDAEGSMAGFSDCRVLSQAVRETETVMLEYPNGTIDCVALLSGN